MHQARNAAAHTALCPYNTSAQQPCHSLREGLPAPPQLPKAPAQRPPYDGHGLVHPVLVRHRAELVLAHQGDHWEACAGHVAPQLHPCLVSEQHLRGREAARRQRVSGDLLRCTVLLLAAELDGGAASPRRAAPCRVLRRRQAAAQQMHSREMQPAEPAQQLPPTCPPCAASEISCAICIPGPINCLTRVKAFTLLATVPSCAQCTPMRTLGPTKMSSPSGLYTA